MTTVTGNLFFELDFEASFIETASKRVRLAASHGTVIVRAGKICWRLGGLQRAGDKLRVRLSSVDTVTKQQRATMKDIASNLGQAASALEDAFRQSEHDGIERIPVFGARIVSHLENLACTFEDMSETAALAASDAFATELRRQLRDNLQESTSNRRAV